MLSELLYGKSLENLRASNYEFSDLSDVGVAKVVLLIGPLQRFHDNMS